MPLVTQRLKEHNVQFEVLFHQPTFHARDEAHRLGIPLADVVKTILIKTRRGHALAVIPASRRLDLQLVHQATGDSHARLATEEEVLRRFPAYPPAALPPLSGELRIPIFVDPEVAAHGSIVFATSKSESIRLSTATVMAGRRTHVVPLVAHPLAEEWEAVAEEVEARASFELDG